MGQRISFSEKYSRFRRYVPQIISVAVVFVSAYIISAFLIQVMLIQGESMEPSYHNMQLVLLDKTCHEYKTGDVVAVRCEGLNAVIVKRIAACPGECVEISDGELYVNDRPVRIGRFTDDSSGERIEDAGIAGDELLLGEREYFVLGDNINSSVDSRSEKVGVITAESIIGRVIGSGNGI